MKDILKGEKNYILFIILVSLLFILWGRIITGEIIREMNTANLTTLNDRIRCVESYGWQVDPGSEISENLRLSENFDDALKEYNDIQKKSGFDLSKYQGEVVTKYTFIILNPPPDSQGMFYANIYVYEKKMIGGEVFSPALSGVMLPIKR